jgi:hypothetical protein
MSESVEKTCMSSLQVTAIVTFLKKKIVQESLSADGRASLGGMLVKVAWGHGDLAQCLAALEGKSKIGNRRKQQNFMNWTAYVSSKEWDMMNTNRADFNVIVQIILEIIVGRLRCVNPTEGTKKFVSTIALYFMATHNGQYSYDSKLKMLQHVKKSWKTRNRIDAREKKKLRLAITSKSCQLIQRSCWRAISTSICMRDSKLTDAGQSAH